MPEVMRPESSGLLEAAPDAIVVVDADGRVVLLNAQAERLFGYRRDELLGQPVELLVPESARALHPEHRLRYAHDPHPRPMGAGMELTARRRDGTEFPAEISLSAVDTESGWLVAAAIRDTTERRRAKDLSRDLLDSAPDAMVCVNDEGRITLANLAAERVFGWARQDLIGQPLEVLLPESARDLHPRHRKSYFADPRPRPMGVGRQLAARRRDGTEFPAEISLSALRSDDGVLVSAAIRDVSERLELEAERERLRVEAETERLERKTQQSQRLESLGQLAGGVAHDFNNLLGAIMNYSRFVAEEVAAAAGGAVDRSWSDVEQDVAQIERAAERAAALTHQLLAFARREVVRPQVLDLNAVISGLTSLLTRTIGEHVLLIVDLAPDLRPTFADPGQVEQVLVNLAVNARDAMPDGGRLVISTNNHTVAAEDAAAHGGVDPGAYVRLRVGDSGIGMAPEVVDRVFEPFFTTKPKGEGTGLGLATVYGIVTQAGGSVSLYSEPGLGTTVNVLLPATSDESTPADPTPPRRPLTGTETVLVVEDEELMRDITVRILTRAGYNVVAAANGGEALAAAERHAGTIDLVVSDVVMPGMLGREVVARLRELRPGIATLFMSGYAEPVLGSRGAVDDGERLLQKPFSAGDLLTAVRSALDHG